MSANHVKAVAVGRPCCAPTWAMFMGMDIAARHFPRDDFAARAALASDIAEMLYRVATPICGGGDPVVRERTISEAAHEAEIRFRAFIPPAPAAPPGGA